MSFAGLVLTSVLASSVLTGALAQGQHAPERHAQTAQATRFQTSATGAVGPEQAPVTLVVFSDFACPYSAQLYFTLQKIEARYPDKLRVLVKQSPLTMIHPDAPLAHRAALAAGRQGKFNEMAELLYANQNKQDLASLTGYARQLHLDILKFQRDIHSATVDTILEKDMEESRGFGILKTPTFYLNGRSFQGIQSEATLAAAIDKAATEETGQAAEAARILNDAPLDAAFTAQLAKAPVAEKGNSAAPLTIVEFTDFQCPFCREAVAPLQQLMAARGREVHWVFRTFPLDFHPDAEIAAEAAVAAGAQGKFWEMHDVLFAHQSALKLADLHGYAQQLKLNVAQFDEALATHQYGGRIAADRALGAKAGVEGTPTFVIDGRLVTGVRSLPEWNQIADSHRGSPAGASVAANVVVPGVPPASTSNLVFGDVNAPMTLTWYTDVRSPLAGRQAELIQALEKRYAGNLRVFYKAFPVSVHADGKLSSQALLAALAQNKFWEMFHAIAAQAGLLDRNRLISLAEGMHMETVAFTKAMDASEATVQADVDEAGFRGIQGAPVIFVNMRRVDGLQQESFYAAILDAALKDAPAIQATAQQNARSQP